MAKRVQLIRHTTGAANLFTGFLGELSIDTTVKELRVHDGATPGGTATARKDLANVNAATVSIDGKMPASAVVQLAQALLDIVTNSNDIATNVANIAINVTNIAINVTNIATNVTNIGLREVAANKGAANGYAALNGSSKVVQTALLADAATAIAGKTFTSADDKIDNFPVGTLFLFQQTTAPTGYTKQTTHNNKSLRVVSGSVVNGGTTPFTTVFGAAKTVGGTAISIAQLPIHNHGGGNHNHTLDLYQLVGISSGHIGSGDNTLVTTTGPTNNSGTIITSQGSGSTHNHTVALDLQFVDIIIASKD